ncbi:unnamed protein product [Didymodactylos carnosus]|uniref:Uncharacterized protein n=1 Tax=Didymodactylos carnosus TaxID=1234261 RepID=A0A815HS12_9BILA|nr:unnamed protein product [Didymodactylos carnosus]CAF1358767.1 unnamed protein product [Didymodactylos carnosus]CAF3536770.1 unnamed protein product [Didymodactylos carnosus]CAF4235218.1 unnamed protein product [Didymodactylos carnosus]
MVNLCSTCKTDPPGCQKDPPEECQNKNDCQCKCTVGSVNDVMDKAVTIGGGIVVAGCGLFLTLATGGLFGILAGGAALGGGMSSVVHGTTKAIEGERIDPESYLTDVGIGAATGALTSGIGAAGEVAATSAVKHVGTEVVNAGATKLAVRSATGVVAGVASKGIDDAIHEENDSSFGSYLASAAAGAIGGAGSHAGSNVTKVIPSGATKSVARIAVSGGTAAVGDATLQGINMAAGNQDEYNLGRTARSAATSGIMTAGQEGIKNEIYRASGGKDNFLHEKTHEKLINEVQNDVIDGYENLKKLPEGALERVQGFMSKYDGLDIPNVHEKALIQDIESRLPALKADLETLTSKLKTEAASNTATAKSKTALQNERVRVKAEIKNLDQMKKATNAALVPEPPSHFFMNEGNAHFLTGMKEGQLAFDVKTPGVEGRALRRAIFDFDPKAPKGAQLKFTGYIDDHNYSKVPNFGEGKYDQTHAECNENLKSTNITTNFTGNQVIQNEQQHMQDKEKDD